MLMPGLQAHHISTCTHAHIQNVYQLLIRKTIQPQVYTIRSTLAGYNFLKMISRKFSLFSTRLSLLRAENRFSDDAFTPE